MGIKKLKPTTPGSRFATRADFSELTVSSPEKRLTRALRKKGVEIIQEELPLAQRWWP